MPNGFCRPACPLIAVVFALLVSSSAHAATQRFVAPMGGTAAPCDSSSPCQLKYALENVAQDGDEVIVAGDQGTYASAAIDLTKAVNVHGAAGQSRPRILGNSTTIPLLQVSAAGATFLRHLQFENLGSVLTLKPPQAGTSIAEDLVVKQTEVGAPGTQRAVSSLPDWILRDSILTAADDDGGALQLFTVATGGTMSARNVTAIATGATSVGVQAQQTCPVTCDPVGPTLDAKNMIARGGAADLKAEPATPSTGPATINVSFSNFRAGKVVTSAPAAVNQGPGNQTGVEPLFVDGAGGDFHETAGSPTIDAGTPDSLLGAVDIDGEARTLGPAPDIGADEVPGPAGGGTGGGGASGGASGGATDVTPAAMTAYAISPNVILPMLSGPSARPAARRRGAIVSYRLSETATVTFAIQRKRPGRRVGRRCVKPTRANRRRRRCVRFVTAGTFTRRGAAGTNRFRFTGRAKGKALPRGNYRLSATTRDAAGNRSRAIRRLFRIIR
jgi:hypothetical protein